MWQVERFLYISISSVEIKWLICVGPSEPEKLTSLSDEQSKKVNFETIHNIDEYGADFVPTMREALKCWNMTVQHWLVVVVYKRFPIKSLRTAAVMLMSSVWHGVYSGYYLSLGNLIMIDKYLNNSY